MSWQFAYQLACEKDGITKRPEISDAVEMSSLLLNGNCPERFTNRVKDVELATLCRAISSVPSVTEVDFTYNEIGDDGAIQFANLVRKNTSIQYISLAHNNIGPAGARALADALMLNMTVLSFCIRGNDIEEDGGIAFGTMLRGNNTLVSLDVAQCGISTKSLISMSQALQTHPALCMLNISKPLFHGPHDVPYVIQHLATTISLSTVLAELTMDHFELYDDHLALLLPALVQNNSITSLSLVGNKLSYDGGVLLAKFLSRRPDIVSLNVSSNHLDDKGAMAVSDAVKNHANLQILNLRANKIGERGLMAIADALQVNMKLSQLYLWGNRFEEPAAAAFIAIRPRVEALQDIDFDTYTVDNVAMICARNN